MDEIRVSLEMQYSTDADTKFKVSMDDAVDNLDGETVHGLMEEIVGLNVLQDREGNAASSAVGCQAGDGIHPGIVLTHNEMA